MPPVTEENLEDLYAVVAQQAQAGEHLLKQLEADRAELKKAISLIERTTQEAVERAIRGALPTVTREATGGVENAAKGVLAALKKQNTEAEDLQSRMERTRASLGWRLSALAVAGAAGFVLAGWISATWQQHAIEQARAELEALQANADDWAKRGGRAKLEKCGDQGRLCVRVEKGTGYGEQSDYMILKGY